MSKLLDWLFIDFMDWWERSRSTIGWTLAFCWIAFLILLELQHGV